MIVVKTSRLSGKVNCMDLPVTEEEIKRHEAGELVQKIWPNLNDDQREFLVSGATPLEWDSLIGEEK